LHHLGDRAIAARSPAFLIEQLNYSFLLVVNKHFSPFEIFQFGEEANRDRIVFVSRQSCQMGDRAFSAAKLN